MIISPPVTLAFLATIAPERSSDGEWARLLSIFIVERPDRLADSYELESVNAHQLQDRRFAVLLNCKRNRAHIRMDTKTQGDKLASQHCPALSPYISLSIHSSQLRDDSQIY